MNEKESAYVPSQEEIDMASEMADDTTEDDPELAAEAEERENKAYEPIKNAADWGSFYEAINKAGMFINVTSEKAYTAEQQMEAMNKARRMADILAGHKQGEKINYNAPLIRNYIKAVTHTGGLRRKFLELLQQDHPPLIVEEEQ